MCLHCRTIYKLPPPYYYHKGVNLGTSTSSVSAAVAYDGALLVGSETPNSVASKHVFLLSCMLSARSTALERHSRLTRSVLNAMCTTLHPHCNVLRARRLRPDRHSPLAFADVNSAYLLPTPVVNSCLYGMENGSCLR